MSAAQHPQPVSVLDGKYALLRELGSGATGTVYEAENLGVGKKVAVKLLRSEVFTEQDGRTRFLTEARAAARIAHANVVDIHDLGVAKSGAPYIVMELLRGETLEEAIDARGPLAPAYACELFLQVLAGLSAAHAQGIVHCDLKPANVLITQPRPDRPLIKLLNFGVARGIAAAQPGAGTLSDAPMFMAPEQVRGDPVDFRTDVYQACAVLFAMLGGTPPFEAPTTPELLQSIAKGRCKDLRALVPDLPTELVQVVMDGMALRRSERIPSAEELAERLRPFAVPAQFESSVVPRDRALLAKPAPLIVEGAPRKQRDEASVIPVRMPRIARMTDSLLLMPRIPPPASTPKLRLGQDFMPLPGDPDYQQLSEERSSPTHVPQRRSRFRRNVVPALLATSIGFGLGVVLAWSAGLL